MRSSTIAALAAALVLCAGGVARAQLATQTWVSGVGDDLNPCTRTAPCKTFTGALAQTAAGGEIDALDPGDFGSITITQALTIDGQTQRSGVIAAASDGITVAAGATDVVVLRHLALVGDGTHAGINFSSGGQLHVVECEISGFQVGVDFEPVAGGQLFVERLFVDANGGPGVIVGTTGASPALGTVTESSAEGNLVGFSAAAGGRLTIYDSVASGNTTGVLASTSAGGTAEVNLESVAVTENGVGVRSSAPAGSALVRMSKVLGTDNSGGPFAVSGNGTITSFGNNRLDVVQSLALSSSASMQTVSSGATATFPVQATVTGLLANPIAFACTGLPVGAACQLSPGVLPGGATTGGPVTVMVTTAPVPPMIGQLVPRRTHGPFAAFVLVPLLAWLGLGRQRRRHAFALLLSMTLMIASCGDSGSSIDLGSSPDLSGSSSPDLSGSEPPDLAATTDLLAPPDLNGFLAPGTYPFQVTATSGALTAQVALTLVVN